MERLSKSINVLNDVAMGRRKADLVLDGCSLVSVYTGEIVPDTQVAVVNGRIAYVGSDASHTIGSKTKTIHLGGKYLVPGFADPHTHIDQFVMPQYLAEKSLLHGTTHFSTPICRFNRYYKCSRIQGIFCISKNDKI